MMRPKGVSKEFIKYSWYFAILSPIDISRNIMPVYFYLLGYGPLEIGILYALATLVQIVLPYLIGTTFRNVSLNKVMALDNILSGLAYALCAIPNRLSFGIAVCLLRCAGSVGSVYQTYSYAVFPEEERVRARAYFLAVPEITQAPAFLAAGIVLGILYPNPTVFRLTLLAMGLLALATTVLPLKWLPQITGNFSLKRPRLGSELKLLLKPIVLADMMIYLAMSLVPMVVWTYYAVNVLNGTFMLVALVEIATSAAIIFTARLVDQRKAKRDLNIGILLIWLSLMLMVKPTNALVMILAYAAGSIGSTLWDPHHINLLYSAIPAELNRQFFGSFSSLKQILTLALLPTATALAEYNISLNYGLSALLVAAALVVYWSILSSSSDATTSLSID